MSKNSFAMIRRCALLVPVCALVAFCAPARAAGPSYASASTSFSGFHFSLVDLAPDDGIAPSVQFLSGAQTQLTAYDSPIFPSVYDFRMLEGSWPGGWEYATASVPGAVSSSSSDGLKAQALLDADLVSANNHSLAGSNNALIGSAWNPDPGRFELSPHTALILEGTFVSEAQLDLASLALHPSLSGADSWDLMAEASARGDLLVYEAGSYNLLGEARLNNVVSATWLKGGQPTVVRDPQGGLPSMSTSFVMRIENTTETTLEALIALTLLSHVQVQANMPAVPEPAAALAALAGTGIVLGARLLRSRRRGV